MRRALLWGLVLLAGCGDATPPPPAELIFVPGEQVRVFASRDGALVATLPAGAFDARLSAGGDISEAYVVGDGVHRIRPGRPFRDERVADATGVPPFQAALAPAPDLTTFAGQPTVLVTLSADGRLAGYQAGVRIWSRAAPGARELRRVDDLVALRTADDWSLLAPGSGSETPLVAGCPLGPLAEVAGRAVVACPAAGATAVQPPAAGRPYVLHPVRQDAAVLAWPDGSWLAVPGQGGARKGAGGGRPALHPDGSRLAWPADYPPARAMASSRDGSVLYSVGGGRLRARRWGGAVTMDVPLEATDLALVAGG